MFWKQFFFNHRFKSYFIQMFFFYSTIYIWSSIGDVLFFNTFFNYSLYCFISIFLSFFIEVSLFIYIIFYILCFKNNNKNSKTIFYLFIIFLILIILFNSVLIFLNKHVFLINLSLQNNFYTLNSKIMSLFLFINIIYILKNKILYNIYNIFLKDILCILCFLLFFICILYSSIDFFIIFISLEGISFVLYTLGSILSKSFINMEAILKYFLINNIASSLLLWTISYIYICIASTDCFEFQYYLIYSFEVLNMWQIYAICILLLLSLFFKLAIFPFHWWIADIYEGFWTPLTVIYAIFIKFSLFLFFFHFILNILSSCFFLQSILLIGSVGSIIYGSLGAIVQVKLKRFLAYTSISQSGYILLGFTTNIFNGILSSFIYLCFYTLTSFCFFLIILNLEHISHRNNIIYINQLYSILFYNKEISFHLISIIFIMAAIPPFNSFFIKFFMFLLLIEIKLEIILGGVLILSLLGSYYYLNLIQQLIFFKLNKTKIYIFNINNIYLIILRIHTLLFILPFFFFSKIYYLSFIFINNLLWPLSYFIFLL